MHIFHEILISLLKTAGSVSGVCCGIFDHVLFSSGECFPLLPRQARPAHRGHDHGGMVMQLRSSETPDTTSPGKQDLRKRKSYQRIERGAII